MSIRTKAPFSYKNKQEFHTNLVEWIGDVLYDILPEHGYEVRDEQIFTAFQIADSICEQKVHLAEAGLGTGKTFAYLLSAIPYARFSGKPVIIACATSALQEQLAGEDGDIKTLSNLLGLSVDARMAKDPRQYICDAKVSANTENLNEISSEMNQWIYKTKRGERSELPTLSDSVWKKIGWDESMTCETCDSRGYCKLVKAREHYRQAADLIIVDHETFFHDLWTRNDRIANGRLPILPSYSAVVFDEGHKIMLPAAMQAGQQLSREDIETIVTSFEEIQGVRESLIRVVSSLSDSCNDFFTILEESVIKNEGAKRLSIKVSDTLLTYAAQFRKKLDQLLLELQIEQELYFENLSTELLQAYEIQIEQAMYALNSFCKNNGQDVIVWADAKDLSFWVVPKDISNRFDQQLVAQKLPVIFTSATLSNEGNFDYINRTLGLKKPSTSSIGSPFDTDEQVQVYLNGNETGTVKTERSKSEQTDKAKVEQLISLLQENGGHALVLVNSLSEVRKLRKKLKGYEFPFELLWEDQADRGYLVRRFREEESSVLIGSDFWEGIDVPGDALNLLIIWQLPFPDADPLLDLQRAEAKANGLDPVTAVDYPEMGLKLKQGCGRLIRTETDHGKIIILDQVIGQACEEIVLGALPVREYCKL